jgi:DNA mismatch repair ATPase MutS
LEKIIDMKNKYDKIKEQYPDAVLLFRCDDFYETIYDDAMTCEKILGITATSRNDMPVVGFHCDNLDTYLPKLVRAGKRVAICDEIEAVEKKLPEICDTSKGEVLYARDVIYETICAKLNENKSIKLKVQFVDNDTAKKYNNFVTGSIRAVWRYHDVVTIELNKGDYTNDILKFIWRDNIKYYMKDIVQVIIE